MANASGIDQIAGFMNSFSDGVLHQLPAWSLIAGVILLIFSIIRFRDYMKAPGSLPLVLPIMYGFFATILIIFYVVSQFST